MIWIAVGAAALAASARLDLAATRLLGASATIPSPHHMRMRLKCQKFKFRSRRCIVASLGKRCEVKGSAPPTPLAKGSGY